MRSRYSLVIFLRKKVAARVQVTRPVTCITCGGRGAPQRLTFVALLEELRISP